MLKEKIKTYYNLTKPGIIYGNVLTVVGGFLLASRGRVHVATFAAALCGASLVMAAGCVFNNYIDRGIDKKMARTKKRALVSGIVSGRSALIYATVLGVAGFLLLAAYTNWLTVGIGAVGIFFYVVVYSVGKRRSVHGTLVGSISGAVPPVAGYCAASNHFDGGALILFLILVAWQMPHFYAIAMYRAKDYGAAGIPVLPVKKGARTTKMQMLYYILAFTLAVASLSVFGFTGYTYLVVMLSLCLLWLRRALQGFAKGVDDIRWARRLFGFSLIVLLGFSIMISLDVVLP